MSVRFRIFFVFFLMLPIAEFFSEHIDEQKVRPRPEYFFTQMENCYYLEIEDAEPGKVNIELPEFPLGAKFSSFKKEEFWSKSGKKGTLITIWIIFSESGTAHIPPLLVKIDGKTSFVEFESVFVHENPNLTSPKIEIVFDDKNKAASSKTYEAKTGEKINFTVKTQYAMQILSFKWEIPKDSLFFETERFEFADGKKKITNFTTEKQNLARFEWKILKEGTYALPEFFVEAVSFGGEKKTLSIDKSTRVIVSGEASKKGEMQAKDRDLFESAFKNPDSDEKTGEKAIGREEAEKTAKNTRLSFFEKIFSKKQAIFSGGEIKQIPEEKAAGERFSGGKKVKIRERTKFWSFIECEEFTGWTKNDNLIEIK